MIYMLISIETLLLYQEVSVQVLVQAICISMQQRQNKEVHMMARN